MIELNPISMILKAHGFGNGGKLQKFADVTIATKMEPYVPFYTGGLRKSVKSSNFGSGELIYSTPYARSQFFSGRKAGTKGQAPLEGRRWDKRFEADKAKQIAKEIEAYGRTI